MSESCNCPNPDLCIRLKKHISGRLWQIWNNENVDPILAQQYRDLWEQQAKEEGSVEAASFPASKGCGCQPTGKLY